jgi:hypothetical protein
MTHEFVFDTKEEFLEEMRKLIKDGVPKTDISVILPHPVHEVDEILEPPPSRLKFFTFGGGITGLIAGLSFATCTSLDWPLITGGKPIIAIPAYIIIAFAMTILFGSLSSFLGFLFLSDLPDIKEIASAKEYGNQFVLLVDRGAEQ